VRRRGRRGRRMLEIILLIGVPLIIIHVSGVFVCLSVGVAMLLSGDLRTKKEVKSHFFGSFVWPYVVFKCVKEEWWDRLP
jgi:hypothetical protein